jgi:hypothetical protein
MGVGFKQSAKTECSQEELPEEPTERVVAGTVKEA